MFQFEIVIESKTIGSNKTGIAVAGMFVGLEKDAAAYAHSYAVEHASRIYGKPGKNSVTRTDKGGWFETAGGTFVNYKAYKQ